MSSEVQGQEGSRYLLRSTGKLHPNSLCVSCPTSPGPGTHSHPILGSSHVFSVPPSSVLRLRTCTSFLVPSVIHSARFEADGASGHTLRWVTCLIFCTSESPYYQAGRNSTLVISGHFLSSWEGVRVPGLRQCQEVGKAWPLAPELPILPATWTPSLCSSCFFSALGAPESCVQNPCSIRVAFPLSTYHVCIYKEKQEPLSHPGGPACLAAMSPHLPFYFQGSRSSVKKTKDSSRWEGSENREVWRDGGGLPGGDSGEPCPWKVG